MLRKISIAIVASAVSVLLSGGIASAGEWDNSGSVTSKVLRPVNPDDSGYFGPVLSEQLAPVGATGIESPADKSGSVTSKVLRPVNPDDSGYFGPVE